MSTGKKGSNKGIVNEGELKTKLVSLKEEREKVKELYIKIVGAIEFVEGLLLPSSDIESKSKE